MNEAQRTAPPSTRETGVCRCVTSTITTPFILARQPGKYTEERNIKTWQTDNRIDGCLASFILSGDRGLFVGRQRLLTCYYWAVGVLFQVPRETGAGR